MNNIIKQVQEACAAESINQTGGYECATAIRALDLSHLTGWQDISTAPKDGTVVLAVDNGHRPTTAACFGGKWASYEDDGLPYHPSHWMPLPPAPKEK